MLEAQSKEEPPMTSRHSPFESLLRHLPIPTVVASAETGLIVWVNDRELGLAGATSPDQIVGHNLLEFLMPEQHGVALRDLEAVTRGESPPPVIYRLRRLDGATVDVMIASVPIKFRDAPAMLSLVTDVTKMERALAELSEENQRYRSLVANSPDGIAVLSEKGMVLFANDALSAALGADTPEALVGRSASTFVAQEERTRTTKMRHAVLKTGEVVSLDALALQRPDGSSRECACSAGLIEWEGDPAVQVVFHGLGAKA